ncbi:hypothetical protein N5C38_18130 [Pseudomonas chengduensis]|nr:hypothetical protein [Pseudomonas chengduensis]MDH1212964.1 hypothetical protein [Pseudomonas chengduensis]
MDKRLAPKGQLMGQPCLPACRLAVSTGLLAAALFSVGCATPFTPVPVAVNFPHAKQEKLQAASHWQLIAEDTARQLIRSLPDDRPLYVSQPATQSPFARVFSQQLISSLLSAGYPIYKRDNGSGVLVVEVSAEPVRFSPNRLQYRYVGTATTLTSGLWVLRNIYRNVSPGAAMVSAAAGLDAAEWYHSEFAKGPTPEIELVVNTSISDQYRYYAQTSSAYYTVDPEWRLYAPGWEGTNVPVIGGSGQ